MVIKGPFEHPGANAVEDENGRLLNLTHMSLQVASILFPPHVDDLFTKGCSCPLKPAQHMESARMLGAARGRFLFFAASAPHFPLSVRYPSLHHPAMGDESKRLLPL